MFSAICRKRCVIACLGCFNVNIDLLREPITSSENGSHPAMSTVKWAPMILANLRTSASLTRGGIMLSTRWIGFSKVVEARAAWPASLFPTVSVTEMAVAGTRARSQSYSISASGCRRPLGILCQYISIPSRHHSPCMQRSGPVSSLGR
jgi:hypothetical protein